MADWYGAARTNYFPVKDAEAFQAWIATAPLRAAKHESEDLWTVLSEDQFGGWPAFVYSQDDEDDDSEPCEFDIVEQLAPHVAHGRIVICMETGAEKLRSLTGIATAFRVTASGIERIDLALSDIYRLAHDRWGLWPRGFAA